MEIGTEVIQDLPLTETTFFILLSLASEPNHGYQIMKEVEVLSESRVRLSTGTLYGALRRLLENGWIERVADPQKELASDERNRKFYTLSRHGRKVLTAEVQRMRELVQAARLRHVEAT